MIMAIDSRGGGLYRPLSAYLGLIRYISTGPDPAYRAYSENPYGPRPYRDPLYIGRTWPVGQLTGSTAITGNLPTLAGYLYIRFGCQSRHLSYPAEYGRALIARPECRSSGTAKAGQAVSGADPTLSTRPRKLHTGRLSNPGHLTKP